MSRNTAFIHVIIVLVVLWFFKSAKLLGTPRTFGAPGLCPAQLIGCDATGNHISWDSTLVASLVKIGGRLRSVERSTRFFVRLTD